MTESIAHREDIPTTVRLDDQLCFALYAATNAVTRAYRPLLDDIGITYPQYLVLLVLWEQRSSTIGAIAKHLHLPAHSISPIIDRLEHRQLVRRVDDPHDGRRVVVELLPAGSDLEVRAAAAWHEVRCRTLLAPAELAELRAQLLDLVDRMDPS